MPMQRVHSMKKNNLIHRKNQISEHPKLYFQEWLSPLLKIQLWVSLDLMCTHDLSFRAIVKKMTGNCHFQSREKSLYVENHKIDTQ